MDDTSLKQQATMPISICMVKDQSTTIPQQQQQQPNETIGKTYKFIKRVCWEIGKVKRTIAYLAAFLLVGLANTADTSLFGQFGTVIVIAGCVLIVGVDVHNLKGSKRNAAKERDVCIFFMLLPLLYIYSLYGLTLATGDILLWTFHFIGSVVYAILVVCETTKSTTTMITSHIKKKKNVVWTITLLLLSIGVAITLGLRLDDKKVETSNAITNPIIRYWVSGLITTIFSCITITVTTAFMSISNGVWARWIGTIVIALFSFFLHGICFILFGLYHNYSPSTPSSQELFLLTLYTNEIPLCFMTILCVSIANNNLLNQKEDNVQSHV
jgi:hypothetical protein